MSNMNAHANQSNTTSTNNNHHNNNADLFGAVMREYALLEVAWPDMLQRVDREYDQSHGFPSVDFFWGAKSAFMTMAQLVATKEHSNFGTTPFIVAHHPELFKLPPNIGGMEWRFCSSEQAYMAAKALFFDAHSVFQRISVESNPAACKRISFGIRNFDSARWDASAVAVMAWILVHKYSTHSDMRAILQAQHKANRIIVEASPFDANWGIGHGIEGRSSVWTVRASGNWGHNKLGLLLMALARVL